MGYKGKVTILLFIAGLLIASDRNLLFALEKNSRNFTMAVMGDSISVGFNAGAPLDQKHLNWATGADMLRRVRSHYFRLRSLLPKTTIKKVNVAKAGSKTSDLAWQADLLLKRTTPDYLALLIGANDVCESSPKDLSGQLNAVESNLRQTLSRLIASNPEIRITMGGIPNLLHLYELGKGTRCKEVWDSLNMCPQLLHSTRTPEERLDFHDRYLEYSKSLQLVAEEYFENVHYVDEVARYRFSQSDISWLDCFHPNAKGQNKISRVTWNKSWVLKQD